MMPPKILLTLSLIASSIASPMLASADAWRPVFRPAPVRPAPPPPVPPPPPRPVPPVRPVPTPPPSHGRLFTPPPQSSDDEEVDVANMAAQAIAGLGCERAGEALRKLSNALLSNVAFATSPPQAYDPSERKSWMREEMRRRWAAHMRSPRFWQKVWSRMAEAYRGCNRDCFDDGVAIGQISGAGYCSASVGVGGLNAPGFAYQPPLPLCQNATFTGCQVGYNQAAAAYQGCAMYTVGGYTSIFDEYKSQDCHMDN